MASPRTSRYRTGAPLFVAAKLLTLCVCGCGVDRVWPCVARSVPFPTTPTSTYPMGPLSSFLFLSMAMSYERALSPLGGGNFEKYAGRHQGTILPHVRHMPML